MSGVPTNQPSGHAMDLHSRSCCRCVTATLLQDQIRQRLWVGRLHFRYGRSMRSAPTIFGVQRLTNEVEQVVGLPGPFLATHWVHTGLGKHIECLGPAGAYATVKWSIVTQATHIVCLGLVKISVCLCVLRVIDRVERRIATFLWSNIALVGAVHVAQVAVLLAECIPLNAMWDPSVHGRCYSPKTAYTTTYVAFSKKP